VPDDAGRDPAEHGVGEVHGAPDEEAAVVDVAQQSPEMVGEIVVVAAGRRDVDHPQEGRLEPPVAARPLECALLGPLEGRPAVGPGVVERPADRCDLRLEAIISPI
jgi:hypothetical protein